MPQISPATGAAWKWCLQTTLIRSSTADSGRSGQPFRDPERLL